MHQRQDTLCLRLLLYTRTPLARRLSRVCVCEYRYIYMRECAKLARDVGRLGRCTSEFAAVAGTITSSRSGGGGAVCRFMAKVPTGEVAERDRRRNFALWEKNSRRLMTGSQCANPMRQAVIGSLPTDRSSGWRRGFRWFDLSD